MTRDTRRVHEGDVDGEVWAALWTAAPFPRVPDDAPDELKKLTIELDDPKRIYAIHRASRRHNFQLLVERYIHQIRYGCQSKTCTTTICFSCRRRVAAGAPIRRYNATSARTLAIYMASQDNPDQGLCHNPSAPRPSPEINRSLGSKNMPIDIQPRGQDSRRAMEMNQTSRSSPNNEKREASREKKPRRKTSVDDVLRKRAGPDLTALEEPTNTDPRSFVQNVFGTVAFRMLEWLTPRNLDLLVRSQSTEIEEAEDDSDSSMLARNVTLEVASGEKKGTSTSTSSDDTKRTSSPNSESSIYAESYTLPTSLPDPKLTSMRESKSSPPPEPTQQSSSVSKLLTTNDAIESHPPKGILNKVQRHPEVGSDILHTSKQYVSPTQRKLPRRSSSHTSHVKIKEKPISSPETKLPILKVGTDGSSLEQARGKDDSKKRSSEEIANAQKSVQPGAIVVRLNESETSLLPQSLSYLSIEVIDFLCDVMQSEGMSENHYLHPQQITEDLKRKRDKPTQLSRLTNPNPSNPISSKQSWRIFIEQGFFDVLSRPDSLVRSFSCENGSLFDTQTIWYLMLRMTRVAPSLVFDSLWNIAGTLFYPPDKLDSTYELVKALKTSRSDSQRLMSSNDAANIINICLHALVAAAPLVFDARQLANMSRIRSYGLAMLGTESSSLEPSTLCLQYEDSFTNELAVRLARRIFSAIPVRRRFTELLGLQANIPSEENQEADILETILGSLKFLDLGTPPTLNFPDSERDLHEKRVPTLILDWARTVMLQEWEGSAEVPSDGPFGGALATMAAIFKNRKDLLLGDIHFRTEYFAERLDPVDMPIGWLSFDSNKRTFHLLDHPFLFNPSTLVTYFRAINYSRMNRAFEEAKAKSGLMYSTIAENSLMTDKYRRDRLYDRLQISLTRFNVLDVGRVEVLKDTFNSIWRREERELLRPLKVRLGQDDGDEGMDSGGVQQEFFRLAMAEALNPNYGTFNIDSRTQMTWFQPASPEPLWKFELIGMIVSLAVYNGLTLPVTFPRALYRKILDQEVSELHHIADGWPDLASGLTTLLEWDEKDGLVEDIFARTYEFSSDIFGQPISREMGTSGVWPQFPDVQSTSNPENAPMVTNENRNSYVSDYIRWLTDVSIRPQFEAFKTGFFSCIDRRSITLFDPETLQSVVEGVQEIDISEMRRTTRYVGWDASHRSVRDFWSIVKRYSLEQKRKLLEFTTASDRVPVGGMRNLQFTLQKNGVDDEHLPSSYTCYGILLLPEYSSKEVLREKLAMALENSKGFGFA